MHLLLNGITTALPIPSLFYLEWHETPDGLVSAADIVGELGLRVYLGPPIAASTKSRHRINRKNDWQSTYPLLKKRRAQLQS